MPTFTTLDFPGAIDTQIFDINNKGEIAGAYSTPDGYHGLLYQDGELASFNAPGSTLTYALAINNAGHVAGLFSKNELFAFVYENQSFQGLSIPASAGGTTLPSGMNERGQIIGTFAYPSPYLSDEHGFLYKDGAVTLIDFPGATFTSPNGMNNKGDIVGSYADGAGLHGFLYQKGHFTALDVPGAVATEATGVNASGKIVGYFQDASFHYHGFLYDHGAFTVIDEPDGDYATYPQDINDAGVIVGTYVNTATGSHGFLLS